MSFDQNFSSSARWALFCFCISCGSAPKTAEPNFLPGAYRAEISLDKSSDRECGEDDDPISVTCCESISKKTFGLTQDEKGYYKVDQYDVTATSNSLKWNTDAITTDLECNVSAVDALEFMKSYDLTINRVASKTCSNSPATVNCLYTGTVVRIP